MSFGRVLVLAAFLLAAMLVPRGTVSAQSVQQPQEAVPAGDPAGPTGQVNVPDGYVTIPYAPNEIPEAPGAGSAPPPPGPILRAPVYVAPTPPLGLTPSTSPCPTGSHPRFRRGRLAGCFVYETVTEPSIPLTIVGGAVFVGMYATNLLFTLELSGGSSDRRTWAFVPLVGPFVDSALVSGDPTAAIMHVVFGILELAGAAVGIWGLIPAERRRERAIDRVGGMGRSPFGRGLGFRF